MSNNQRELAVPRQENSPFVTGVSTQKTRSDFSEVEDSVLAGTVFSHIFKYGNLRKKESNQGRIDVWEGIILKNYNKAGRRLRYFGFTVKERSTEELIARWKVMNQITWNNNNAAPKSYACRCGKCISKKRWYLDQWETVYNVGCRLTCPDEFFEEHLCRHYTETFTEGHEAPVTSSRSQTGMEGTTRVRPVGEVNLHSQSLPPLFFARRFDYERTCPFANSANQPRIEDTPEEARLGIEEQFVYQFGTDIEETMEEVNPSDEETVLVKRY